MREKLVLLSLFQPLAFEMQCQFHVLHPLHTTPTHMEDLSKTWYWSHNSPKWKWSCTLYDAQWPCAPSIAGRLVQDLGIFRDLGILEACFSLTNSLILQDARYCSPDRCRFEGRFILWPAIRLYTAISPEAFRDEASWVLHVKWVVWVV